MLQVTSRPPLRKITLTKKKHLNNVSLGRTAVVVRAETRSSEGSFVAGFVLGGVVFGTLGFILAPQLSRAMLGDDQRLKLSTFLDEDSAKNPEQAKQDLAEKIAQLNASIDEVAAQLKSKEISNSIPEEGMRIVH